MSGGQRRDDVIRVGLAQIAPVWLDRAATLDKVASYVNDAGDSACDLVVFGEALVPGYPFWIERTDGARFNSPAQKRMFAHYLDQGVVLERGDLDEVARVCRQKELAAYVGIVERAPDRGGHSLYCSRVYIASDGRIASVHRKTQPTYEERLVWAPGDGHGLVVHRLGAFTVGGLNCFENWMPLVRASLHAQGEDVHVAVWPGGLHNTRDLTRFLAIEGRSHVVSVSGLLRPADIPAGTPLRDEVAPSGAEPFANGGSCVAGPDGEWILEPVVAEEGLFIAELDHERVRGERQNFDLAGHYSRPDVTQLKVDRARQSTAIFTGSAQA
jgi:nitrilase